MCDQYLRGARKTVICSVVHLLVFTLFIIGTISQQDINNYGPYIVVWETFEACKGPKQGECGTFKITDIHNMSDVNFMVDFPKDCPATMGKIVVTSNTNNVTKKLWNYVLNKPCEHFVMGPVLVSKFNLNKDCKIIKGYYEIHADFIALAKIFLGKNFFYGNYTFQIMTYNRVNNFFCIKTRVQIRKHT